MLNRGRLVIGTVLCPQGIRFTSARLRWLCQIEARDRHWLETIREDPEAEQERLKEAMQWE